MSKEVWINEILNTRRYSYQRVGWDEREIEFLEGFKIGRGSERCETRWHLIVHRGNVQLELLADETITCTLGRQADGTWKGQWMDFERMEVQLVPIKTNRTILPLPDAANFQAGSPNHSTPPIMSNLCSQLVTQDQVESDEYKFWSKELCQEAKYHRKEWEFAYILQTVFERGLMKPGCKGLGFGVGKEKLPSVLAKYGCQILATDQSLENSMKSGWRQFGIHASSLCELHNPVIIDWDTFQKNVSYRTVDMNFIPLDLQNNSFDFVWSACSLEHLGSLDAGIEFIINSLKCIRKGGVVVHTTEYNLTSNHKTISKGSTVIYRRQDIEALVEKVRSLGYEMYFNSHCGNRYIDQYYDIPPYRNNHHLKLLLSDYITTSLGLIIHSP